MVIGRGGRKIDTERRYGQESEEGHEGDRHKNSHNSIIAFLGLSLQPDQ